jgi:tellurite resistance protein TerC
VGLALGFNAAIWYFSGSAYAMQFLTGYIIEKTLSIDNLFVFVMIFDWLAVPIDQQPRVLSWGVIGALVFRAVFISGGVALIHHFFWMTWVFGALLLLTSFKMLRPHDQAFDGNANPFVRIARRFLPISASYDGQRMITLEDGRQKFTIFLLVLLVVEVTDIMFAVDSIPAVIAVTTDPFIIFTSNVFAILGLRALYFLLAGFLHRLQYLRHGLAAILFFIGAKMLVGVWIHIPVLISLLVILGILAVATFVSLAYPPGRAASKTDG